MYVHIMNTTVEYQRTTSFVLLFHSSLGSDKLRSSRRSLWFQGYMGGTYLVRKDIEAWFIARQRMKLTGFDECVWSICAMGAFIKYVILFFVYNRNHRAGSRY